MSGQIGPIAAQGHMPFPGHRTVAEIEGADRRPVAVVQFGSDGDIRYALFGEGTRLLIIDERALPSDRVFEITERQPLKALDALVPPATVIGHKDDSRQAAAVARMTALFEGRPHLQPVPTHQDDAA